MFAPRTLAALRIVFVAGIVASCNAVLGISDSPTVKKGLGSCLLNSDCPTNNVCVFEHCSNQCAADRDCVSGFRCLRTMASAGCVGMDNSRCSSTDACPKGAECAGGVCRNACGIGTACFDDQRCDVNGVCVGTDPARDPLAGDAGRISSKDGGAGGRGQGGSGDATGSGGAGGTSRGGTTSTDAGPDASGLDAGPACSPEGGFRCEGAAQASRSVCHSGKWAAAPSCQSGQLCDNSTGSCAPVSPACQGHKPADVFCNGTTRTECGPDLVTVTTDECSTTQLCSLSTTSKCAACLPGQYACSGLDLQVCNANRTAFEFFQTCTTTAPCNEAAHACTALACLANQKRCNGDRLELCNAAQTGWDLQKQCAAGLCDAVALECDICPAGKTSCSTTTAQLVCQPDGQSQATVGCPTATPHCVGAGQCVQCTADAQCTAPDSCHTATCNSGTGQCAYPAKTPGDTCSGGYCDSTAKCVACLNPTQCGAAPDTCHTVACNVGVCAFPLKGGGATCSGGKCTAAGACVQCLAATDCTSAPGECYTPTCPVNGGACTYPKKPPSSSCSGGVCATSGACVQCLSNSNCPVGTTCNPGSCNTATDTCRLTAAPSGTTCSGGVCSGTGSCVACVNNGNCGTNEVCRGNVCLNATESVGWPSALAGSSTLAGDVLYYFPLPPLSHNAVLSAFGVYGNAAGASVKMALYKDDGTGSQPVGAQLAETQSPINLTALPTEQAATIAAVLSAGAVYWVAIIANTTTTIRSQSAAGAKGWHVPSFGYGNFFSTAANPPGIAQNGFNWNLYIVIQDTQ